MTAERGMPTGRGVTRGHVVTKAPRGTGDRGAGSILAVAVLAAIVSTVGLVLPATAVVVGRARAAGASDASALAAADVAAGLRPGSPCAAAESVAKANGAILSGCSIDGMTATVEVGVGAGILDVSAVSTAGQPLRKG